jgi:hypothetical protein
MVANAERLRTSYWQRVRSFMERFDYILTPTVGAPPFRLDEPLPQMIGGRPVARYYDVFLATYAFSVIGLPALSTPCGVTHGGLPVGLQIVGRRLCEDSVPQAAAAFAEVRPEYFTQRALSSVGCPWQRSWSRQRCASDNSEMRPSSSPVAKSPPTRREVVKSIVSATCTLPQ